MKFPTSPLLLGLALTGSTLAYPAPPGARSPNPESSPLLGSEKSQSEERGWAAYERDTSRLGKSMCELQPLRLRCVSADKPPPL